MRTSYTCDSPHIIRTSLHHTSYTPHAAPHTSLPNLVSIQSVVVCPLRTQKFKSRLSFFKKNFVSRLSFFSQFVENFLTGLSLSADLGSYTSSKSHEVTTNRHSKLLLNPKPLYAGYDCLSCASHHAKRLGMSFLMFS